MHSGESSWLRPSKAFLIFTESPFLPFFQVQMPSLARAPNRAG